jgi:hypothetical protein
MISRKTSTCRWVLIVLYSLMFLAETLDFLATSYGDGIYQLWRIIVLATLGSSVLLLIKRNWKFVFPTGVFAAGFFIKSILFSGPTNGSSFLGLILGFSFQVWLVYTTFKGLKSANPRQEDATPGPSSV